MITVIFHLGEAIQLVFQGEQPLSSQPPLFSPLSYFTLAFPIILPPRKVKNICRGDVISSVQKAGSLNVNLRKLWYIIVVI